jgi:2-keto-4-pentenoate hydratase
MQKLCGVDEPCFGAIFANEVHHHRAELPVGTFCRLGVETEIAVRLGADLPQGGDRARVEAAVESCMAAIELLEDLHHDCGQQEARRPYGCRAGGANKMVAAAGSGLCDIFNAQGLEPITSVH